ncbi:hypothetical protein Adu01nite_37700 [Paractinoplanes durhamensis]|uniref:Uncharacterized protein n=1 Tax=Paractinoplanes durhamensis TaxID=113563 RepID=A0ABQ3YXV6_9ACTN|nr:hypothetical protein Adu01nite_37700 [Actinoplanes durhamensis]
MRMPSAWPPVTGTQPRLRLPQVGVVPAVADHDRARVLGSEQADEPPRADGIPQASGKLDMKIELGSHNPTP